MHYKLFIGFVIISFFMVGCISLQQTTLVGDEVSANRSTPNDTQILTLPFSNKTVCYYGNCLTLEIADTAGARARGLMGRTSLAADAGMLFVFPEDGNYSFWMKDTLIPLDMIWLDKDWNVLSVIKNAQPCTQDPCTIITPGVISRYVIEVNAGTADRLGIKTGAKLSPS